jgi:hypothetical protein
MSGEYLLFRSLRAEVRATSRTAVEKAVLDTYLDKLDRCSNRTQMPEDRA